MNYYHLNIDERIVIAQLKKSGVSIREIAHHLHRSPSTISRELKRNSYKTGYKYALTLYILPQHIQNIPKGRLTVVEKLYAKKVH